MKKNYIVIAKHRSEQWLKDLLNSYFGSKVSDPIHNKAVLVEVYENATSAKARICTTEESIEQFRNDNPELIVEDEVLYTTCS